MGPSPLIRRVASLIREQELIGRGDAVVVAVSGGADSVALLDLLVSMTDLEPRLVVAHLNHGLRGEAADGDEHFVRELAGRYGLEVESRKVDVLAMSRARRLSLEEAGREARREFLREVAGNRGARVVALAHHADDQAETLLMRLIRGAGGEGLAGMRPRSADGLFVRPLLAVNRRDIETYLRQRGLGWREDESNRELNFLRNRLRHELLPFLATYNPAIGERLTATAETLAADERLLERLTVAAFAGCGRLEEGRVTLAREGVCREDAGLRLRLYRRAIRLLRGNLRRISFRHLRAIDRLLLGGRPNARLLLPEGLEVARSYESLVFRWGAGAESGGFEILVEGPGSYPLPGGTLAIEPGALPSDWQALPADTILVDGEAAPFPWLLRPFRPGDRLVPFGMSGSRKVKELFIDRKVPAAERSLIPLLFSGETLIWVCGLRRAAAATIGPGSTSVLRVRFASEKP